jgi:ribosomal protein S20
MPVTKTAKRALRSSQKKAVFNKLTRNKLEIALRKAKKTKSQKSIAEAMSLADKAAKKFTIHQKKADRIKHSLARLA